MPPAPVPYREPLFATLAGRLDLHVIYQSAAQPSWDVDAAWFPADHPYPASHLRARQHRRPGRTPIVWSRGLERALSTAEPDCVVVSEYGPASLRSLAWCRRRSRAYVIFTECTAQIDSMLGPAQLRLHRTLARHADGLIAVSSQARERLLSFGVHPERIAIALQSADLAPVRAAAAARAVQTDAVDPDRPLTVLSVARLVPDKNLGALIRAFALAGLTPAQARLEIVGTGFLEDDLRRLADQHGVPVRFHGALAPTELPRLYAAADVYAAVSTYEPFGVSIREATAAGLPILTGRRAGAVGDVAIGDRNAILVDPAHTQEIADALARLVRDADLRLRLGAESLAIDAATDGGDADAFAGAVLAAALRRGRASAL
ncbi:MAG: glycosyltransferase family 4 protein [Solirubrobacteraceae bacterium]